MAFIDDLLKHAAIELQAMGGAKEPGAHSSQSAAKTALARELIKKYWMVGVGYSSSAAETEINKRTAWSAAFISYCVRQALEEAADQAVFSFNPSHSVYIGQALRNDFNGLPSPAFYGEPATGIGKVKVAPGDIVGWSRTANIASYDDALAAARKLPKPETYFSHCDIVTSVSDEKAVMVGGNVSDTVKETTVMLDGDGCMPVRPFRKNPAGAIISGPFIVVVRHR